MGQSSKNYLYLQIRQYPLMNSSDILSHIFQRVTTGCKKPLEHSEEGCPIWHSKGQPYRYPSGELKILHKNQEQLTVLSVRFTKSPSWSHDYGFLNKFETVSENIILFNKSCINGTIQGKLISTKRNTTDPKLVTVSLTCSTPPHVCVTAAFSCCKTGFALNS